MHRRICTVWTLCGWLATLVSGGLSLRIGRA